MIKNGTTRRGNQNHKCRACDRQFVENPQGQPKDKLTCSLIDRWLLENHWGSATGTGMVFVEGDISHPVQSVFNRPMLLNRAEELHCTPFQVTNVTDLLLKGSVQSIEGEDDPFYCCLKVFELSCFRLIDRS